MSKRYESLDSLKFVFSIIIVYFHLVRTIPQWGGGDALANLAEASNGAHLIVECFLIIAGYFIYSGFRKGKYDLIAFFIARFIRLWPVMCFYVLVVACLRSFNIENLLTDLFLLRGTGLSTSYKDIVWYVAPFFWSSLIAFVLLTTFRYRVCMILFVLIFYTGYCVNINNLGGNMGRSVVYSWLSLGMIRCLSGISVGILLAAVKDAFTRRSFGLSVNRISSYVLCSVVEVICFSLLCVNFLFLRLFSNSIITVVLFSCLMMSFISRGGCISYLLSFKISSYCGKFCYSIYVMQLPSFLLMKRTLWKSEWFWNCLPLGIALSLLVSVLLGILTYMLVEKPISLVLSRYFLPSNKGS